MILHRSLLSVRDGESIRFRTKAKSIHHEGHEVFNTLSLNNYFFPSW